jgi:hypothetical protein
VGVGWIIKSFPFLSLLCFLFFFSAFLSSSISLSVRIDFRFPLDVGDRCMYIQPLSQGFWYENVLGWDGKFKSVGGEYKVKN